MFNTATYMHSRTPMKVLGSCTIFKVLYRVKPDVLHLHAFGVLCAIVEPKERLRKLDDRRIMCFFVGYKYVGGGYWVWDPKRQVVVKSRDILLVTPQTPTPQHHFGIDHLKPCSPIVIPINVFE